MLTFAPSLSIWAKPGALGTWSAIASAGSRSRARSENPGGSEGHAKPPGDAACGDLTLFLSLQLSPPLPWPPGLKPREIKQFLQPELSWRSSITSIDWADRRARPRSSGKRTAKRPGGRGSLRVNLFAETPRSGSLIFAISDLEPTPLKINLHEIFQTHPQHQGRCAFFPRGRAPVLLPRNLSLGVSCLEHCGKRWRLEGDK